LTTPTLLWGLTNNYLLMYDDKGSDADMNGSFYRAAAFVRVHPRGLRTGQGVLRREVGRGHERLVLEASPAERLHPSTDASAATSSRRPSFPGR